MRNTLNDIFQFNLLGASEFNEAPSLDLEQGVQANFEIAGVDLNVLTTGSLLQAGPESAQVWIDNFNSGGATSQGGVTRNASEHSNTTDGTFDVPGDYAYITTDAGSVGAHGPSTFAVFSGFTGSYWRAEDLDGIPGPNFADGVDVIDWTGINIAGQTDLEFSGLFAAISSGERWDNDDFVRIQVQIDGGGYITILQLEGNESLGAGGGSGDLAVDTNNDGVGDGVIINEVFQNLTASISGTGTTLDLRIIYATDSANEELGFDDFSISAAAAPSAPVVTIPNPGSSFTEDLGPILITSNTATVTDSDTNIQSMTVTITDFVAGDELAAVAFGAITAGQISYNGAGVLTITSDASASDYQTVLNSVTYNTLNQDPTLEGTDTQRNFTIVANDGTGNSNTANAQATIIADNDDPVIAGDLAATVVAARTVVITISDLTETDPDDSGVSLTYTVTGTANGQVEFLNSPNTAITSFTQADLDNGDVVFRHDSSASTTSSFTVTLTDDESATTGPSTINLTVTPPLATVWTDAFDSGGATSQAGVTRNASEHVNTTDGTFDVPGDYAYITTDAGSAVAHGPITFAVFSGFTGSYWRAEDLNGITSNGNFADGTDVIDWTGIDISGRTNLEFSGLFAAISAGEAWDNDDFVQIQVQIDGGGYVTILTLEGNESLGGGGGSGDLAVDTNNDGVGDGLIINETFQSLFASITGTGNSLDLRLIYALDSANEEIGFDDFAINADAIANFAPVAGGIEGTAFDYQETGGAQAITQTLTLSDLDDTDLEGATIAITAGLDIANDTLNFTAQNGITGSYVTATGILTLTGTSSVANYQAAIRSITYLNAFTIESIATRTISITVNDGDDNSNTLTRDFTMTVDETIIGTSGDDLVNSGFGKDTVNGLDGMDILNGETGNDFLFGGNGDDMLSGGGDHDVLNGGLGEDTLMGGSGNDQLRGRGNDDALFGGDGIDFLDGGGGEDMLDGGDNRDTLIGGGGQDILLGGGGRDTLDGGDQDDILEGGGASDMLFGGAGDDDLSGGAASDILDAGTGHDRLTGDGGADTFVFSNTQDIGVITDFQNGLDVIDLSGHSAYADFAAVMASAAQFGGAVIIYNGANDVIAIQNFTLTDLDASDFIF